MDNENQQQPAEPVAPKVYASQAEQDGLVEIVNADGSKSQVKREVAEQMVANLENLKASLGQ